VDDGRQYQGTSSQKIQKEFHRAVLFPRVTPYGDERVHGEEGDIVPDKEEKEVHAHKEAENPGDQQKEKAEEFFDPMIQFPWSERP
jgi:hypothetical protein